MAFKVGKQTNKSSIICYDIIRTLNSVIHLLTKGVSMNIFKLRLNHDATKSCYCYASWTYVCLVPLSLILSVEFYGAIKYFLVGLCSSFGSCRSNDNAYDSALGRSLQWRHLSFMVTQITHNWTVCSTICRDSVATKNCKGYSLVPLTKGQ